MGKGARRLKEGKGREKRGALKGKNGVLEENKYFI